MLVQVHDLAPDPLGRPFDARASRHVGRRDVIADFAGVWDGKFTSGGSAFLFRVVITQTGLGAACAFYSQVSGRLPTSPQSTGTGTIVGTRLSLMTTDFLSPGHQFTTNQWTPTLPDPDTLHVENVHAFPPGDGRPTQHRVADLHRI